MVKGEGKLEQLIVCSQEIAASTAQLVVSSRVKAKQSSNALQHVQEASKNVSRATGSVVASVKTGVAIIEDQSKCIYMIYYQSKCIYMIYYQSKCIYYDLLS